MGQPEALSPSQPASSRSPMLQCTLVLKAGHAETWKELPQFFLFFSKYLPNKLNNVWHVSKTKTMLLLR